MLENVFSRGYEIEEKIRKGLKSDRKYTMILNFAQKPDEEEYYQLAKVSLGVLLFIGFIGFLVYLAFHYLLGR